MKEGLPSGNPDNLWLFPQISAGLSGLASLSSRKKVHHHSKSSPDNHWSHQCIKLLPCGKILHHVVQAYEANTIPDRSPKNTVHFLPPFRAKLRQSNTILSPDKINRALMIPQHQPGHLTTHPLSRLLSHLQHLPLQGVSS